MATVAVDLSASPRAGFLPRLSLGPRWRLSHTAPALTALIGALGPALRLALAGSDGLQGSAREIIDLATVCGVTATG
jgi:hypothetical protein